MAIVKLLNRSDKRKEKKELSEHQQNERNNMQQQMNSQRSPATLVRLVDYVDNEGEREDNIKVPRTQRRFERKQKQIVGWSCRAELPGEEDAAQSYPHVKDTNEDIDNKTLTGEKLSGHPSFVQGPEYPMCPHCNTEMQFVFQIDSEQNVGWMFGDMGCGHIYQCRSHLDVLTFGWACS